MASIWMLEDVVIIGGLCLLCSAIALTLLTLLQDDSLKYIVKGIFRRFVSKSTNHRKKQKRLKKEQKDERINEKTQAIADNVSWQEIFTVKTTPVLSELKLHVVNTALIRPCSKCNDYNAKRNCQFNCCSICCRSNPYSVCKAHKTGYQSAVTVVEEAVKYGYPEVDISYCHLRESPPRVTSLEKYTVSLNLSNNRLSTLPEDLGSLTGLQELFLQYNHLTYLPTSLCQLTRLVELDIKNNMLTYIPDDIGHLTSLSILCLTNNFLSSLSPSIGQLVHLEELSLHSNLLKSLPDEVCQLQELKYLYCGENKLQNLPDQFGKLVKLEELDLSGCELIKLPESLCHCKLLMRLWLTNNKLVGLPTHIGNLRQLKELHVRKNCLRVFPMSIKKLTLYTFTAQNNPILKEHQITQFSHTPKINFPPLLELAGRTLIRERITWRRGHIPISLEEMLMCSSSCTQCGRPILTYYTCRVSFHLVGVFYRLPLYEQLCSPHNTTLCGGLTD